jgi:hypothetical protein
VKKTCAQRETLTIAGFALDGSDWDGIYLGRRKGKDLVYAGKVDHGFDKTSAAALRKRPTPLIRKTRLRQEDRAQGHLAGAGAAGRDRIPCEVDRGQGAAPVLQGSAGGPMMKTVWIYVDTSKQVGDVDHLKVFASRDLANEWLQENDPEGVAFEYDVIGVMDDETG